jgi:hypothetical protein
MTLKLKPNQIPCKYERHFKDRVPAPFGSGDCDMPGFECAFDGDPSLVPAIEAQTECSPQCPSYKAMEVKVCKKHDEEFVDWCGSCEEEAYAGKVKS